MDSPLRAGMWLGPLHGIPYGLKDLFDTKGITTGWGQSRFRAVCLTPMPQSPRSCARPVRC